MLTTLNVRAQETTSKIETKVETPKTAFKLKSELRSSINSFSDKSSISQFRLRFDPNWSLDEWTIGLRQDMKNKFSNGKDDYTIENMRTFIGRNYKVSDWQIQARLEAWLPTNVKDRTQLSYQGSPGVGVKIKRKWLSVTSNYELNVKKMFYQSSKGKYSDWVLFNEFKNEIRLSKTIVGNLNIKFDDSWDQNGNRGQKYLFEQSIGFSLASNFDFEIGHAIEKQILVNNSSDSFALYDKDYSQLYTALSYIY